MRRKANQSPDGVNVIKQEFSFVASDSVSKVSIQTFLVALLFAFGGTAYAEKLAIVAESELLESWQSSGSTSFFFTIKITKDKGLRYGCLNIGFVVEADGRISGPARLLSHRFNKPLAASDPLLRLLTGLAFQQIPPFTPAPDNASPRASYTSFSVPVLTHKIQKSLNEESTDALVESLKRGCEVQDLLGRLKDPSKDSIEGPPLPSLEELTNPDTRNPTESDEPQAES